MTLTEAVTERHGTPPARPGPPRRRPPARLAAWVMALLVAGAAVVASVRLVQDGYWPVALLVAVLAVILLAALLRSRQPALRWLAPAFLLLAALVAYPAVYVGYLAFTNYSSEHPVPLERAVELIATAPAYQVEAPGSTPLRYSVYRDAEGELLLWMSGRGEASLGRDGEPLLPVIEAAADGVVPLPAGLEGEVLTGGAAADLLAPDGTVTVSGITVTVREFDADQVSEEDLSGDGLVLDPVTGLLQDLRGEPVEGSVPPLYRAGVVDDPDGPALWAVGQSESNVLDGDRAWEQVDLPESIEGFRLLSLAESVSAEVVQTLSASSWGEPPDVLRLNPSDPTVISRYEFRFAYDDEAEVFRDIRSGAVYRPENGNFTLDPATAPAPADAEEAVDQPETLRPGFVSLVGVENFARILEPAQRSTLLDLLVWSILFAGLGVVFAFFLGLGAAILVNDPRTPLRGLARSLLVLPYAMPVFLTVTLWRFFLDPSLGPVNQIIAATGLPIAPNWTGDPLAARIALVLIMTWIFFPYFMLVGGGALQSISPELYGAAAVDGADGLRGFRYITLPLVFAACGPILVATFAFFFTNVTIIELFLRGGPRADSTGPPYGYTDIVASYAYHQAFPPNGNADFGYASAVAVLVFLLLGALSYVQIRLSRLQEAWHEGS